MITEKGKPITIPQDVSFNDLSLRIDQNENGTVDLQFKQGVIERICEANDIDFDEFSVPENLSAFITQWYQAHKRMGGRPNFYMEGELAKRNTSDKDATPYEAESLLKEMLGLTSKTLQ